MLESSGSWISIKEAAVILHCPKRLVTEIWIERGLPIRKLDRCKGRFVRRADLQSLLDVGRAHREALR